MVINTFFLQHIQICAQSWLRQHASMGLEIVLISARRVQLANDDEK